MFKQVFAFALAALALGSTARANNYVVSQGTSPGQRALAMDQFNQRKTSYNSLMIVRPGNTQQIWLRQPAQTKLPRVLPSNKRRPGG
jgi:hypothetical protein